MAPSLVSLPIARRDANATATSNWRASAEQHPEDLILESWSEGFFVGALIIMACITIANMRKGVILHKLILLEQLLAMPHGSFCFMSFHGYGWYLSGTASLLYMSWLMHNIVAWLKIRPFFSRKNDGFFSPRVKWWTSRIYLITYALTVPFVFFQVSNNFRYFNNRGGWYVKIRAYEPIARDPWWVFSCLILFYVVRKHYEVGVLDLIKTSPRFGILLVAIFLAIAFTCLDVLASVLPVTGSTEGVNPGWKLSLVFKCLTDTIMLDDFKTVVDRLTAKRMRLEEARRGSVALMDDEWDRDPTSSTAQRRYDAVRSPSMFSAVSSPLGSNPQSPRRFLNANPFDLDDGNTLRGTESQHSQYSQRGRKNSSVRHEQVELTKALSELAPPRVSNAGSDKRDSVSHIREHIGATTRKLSQLPGLCDFTRFESIKPGRKSSRDNNNQEMKEKSPRMSSSIGQDPVLRNIHEEIQRNTMMDLMEQKRAKAARARCQDVRLEAEDLQQIDQEMVDLEGGHSRPSRPSVGPLGLGDLDQKARVDEITTS